MDCDSGEPLPIDAPICDPDRGYTAGCESQNNGPTPLPPDGSITICDGGFESTFESMLRAESDLDGWVHLCQVGSCLPGTRDTIRSSAVELDRRARTLLRNYAGVVCRGDFSGGDNSYSGEVSATDEASRAIDKARQYMNF